MLGPENVTRDGGEERGAVDGGSGLGPWLVAVHQWLPGSMALIEQGKKTVEPIRHAESVLESSPCGKAPT